MPRCNAPHQSLSSVQPLAGLIPYERYYNEPVYDTIDLVGGGFDPEGNPIPDGRPDNPGNILFHKPIRTGQKTNFSINGGITAQISIPLDRSHIRTCRRAAEKQVELMEAALADKRLNYELARLKTARTDERRCDVSPQVALQQNLL